jgi:hypothetical protein
MIITDKLVFIHMPKTGGTFATSVLERLHQPVKRRFLGRVFSKAMRALGRPRKPRLRYGALENLDPKHGTCHDIPAAHRDKPILSCMRGPHEWCVSQYEFAWWKQTQMYDPNGPPTPAGHAIEQVLPAFAAERPHFPDISFSEFMDLCERASRVYDPEGRCGLYTHGFSRYYFKNPHDALARFTPEYFSSGTAQQDMFEISFIHTEALNRELERFLRQQGYRDEDLQFIRDLEKILPEGRGRREDQHWQGYYTPALERYVREKDWALYELFPRYRQSAP